MEYRFNPDTLSKFCTELLVAAGVPEEQAITVTEVLVDTTLDGIDTHGISRLPIYLTCLQSGRINAKPLISITQPAPSVAVVDGDNGLGQLVAVHAMEKAIKIAGQNGTCAAAVKNSNHFGAATYYCKMATKADMIGIAFTNSPPGIPPWGGKKPYFGTNPIAFGFPAAENPVIVDMSSSNVARGNIILAAKEGRPIPEGWAIDTYGRPTTDATKALDGAVLPMGGPKGYALATAVEVLSGIVSGAAYGPHVGWIYDDNPKPANVGHFFMVINIEPLISFTEYRLRMENMINEIRAIPLAEGFDSILLPGERKKNKAKLRLKQGIPIKHQLLKELNDIAAQLNVNGLFPGD